MWAVLAGVVSSLMLCAPVLAQSPAEFGFACRIGSAAGEASVFPVWGREFSVTVTFGEGESLALLDPETGAPQGMVHRSDVLTGQFVAPAETGTIVWTRANSRRAPLVGLTVRSDGHVVTLMLDRAAASGPERALTVLDSASAAIWRGSCTAR